MFKFEIIKKSKKSKARLGRITTVHQEILTPAFLPVATLGVVKGGVAPEEVETAGVQCQIVNSFHLLDLDRIEEIAKKGGLHQFFNFTKPIFTDSGGFQIFSLGRAREFGLAKVQSVFSEKGADNPPGNNLVKRISEQGVLLSSPRDGREIFLTPEISAEIQKKLGADFIYVLDICGTVLDDFQRTKREMERSHRWYKRFLNVEIGKNQRVFGIVQGGLFKELRARSTDFVNNLPVFGIALGGALGRSKKEMFNILRRVGQRIDRSRPCHILGIGDLESVSEAIRLGIDLFDCALPTRLARHGVAIKERGERVQVSKAKFKSNWSPISKGCSCYTCRTYSLGQLNFLLRAKETLAGRLLTLHNLFFLEQQFKKFRQKIETGKF